ncbi:MAG: hypothetical protein ACOC7L_04450, partial [Acidobacteriota bacterium]
RRYTGPLTPVGLRFLVIPRYAWKRLSGSKVLWMLLVASGLFTLGAATLIYLKHNTRALEALQVQVGDLLPIDAAFFQTFLGLQLGVAFLLVLVAGPALISMDTANGALPLYLARPLSRAEYVGGKLTVLAALLSPGTWVVTLGLFGLQTVLEGAAWGAANARIAVAIFAGSWVWILVLSFLVLALSALIRWPLAVRGVLLVLFLVLPGFGQAFAQVLRTPWGHVLNPGADLSVALGSLFGRSVTGPPVAGAWLALGAIVAGSLLVIARKLRAYEVVT